MADVFLKGNNQLLYFPLSFFSLGENKLYRRLFFIISPPSECQRNLFSSSSLHWGSQWVPAPPDRNKLLCLQWYLGFFPNQWRAKSICNFANTVHLPQQVTEDGRQGGLCQHQLQRWTAHPSTYPHRFSESLLIQGGWGGGRGWSYSKYILNLLIEVKHFKILSFNLEIDVSLKIQFAPEKSSIEGN